MVGEDGSKWTDVTMMCGRRHVLWSLAIASLRVVKESIVVSESSLSSVSKGAEPEDARAYSASKRFGNIRSASRRRDL